MARWTAALTVTVLTITTALAAGASGRPALGPPALPATPDLSQLKPLKVARVIDGDTVRIQGYVIRLIGMDAPEQYGPHGRESTSANLGNLPNLRILPSPVPALPGPSVVIRVHPCPKSFVWAIFRSSAARCFYVSAIFTFLALSA